MAALPTAVVGPCAPRPAARVAGVQPYRVAAHPAPVDLDLRGNEGPRPDADTVAALQAALADPDLLRRYPDTRGLEARLADAFDLDPACVIVSAGGDDALDRLCRATLQPGRTLVFPRPGFEMTARYAALAGGAVVDVAWPGDRFPVDGVCAAIDARTGLVALTSPNNPTGAVVEEAALRQVSRAAAAVGATVLLDLAYVEFADSDPTAAALALGNVVVVRTLSKAWGLAGLRVGYALGPAEVIGWLRAAGAPYAVAAPSLALAEAAWAQGPRASELDRIRGDRQAISEALQAAGCAVVASQANFVFARSPRAAWLADGLAGLGVAVRTFPGQPGLEDALRVAVPPGSAETARVVEALATVARPEALLFDMDGVLVDVSSSYRVAIQRTAADLGVTVTPADIAAMKAAGDANNDWVLTWRLVRAAGVEVSLDEVTARFEAWYQGSDAQPGLWTTEQALVDRASLQRLSTRVRLGVVTGRPAADARRFLDQHDLADLFETVVTMEDAPAKPDPAPVRLALQRMGVKRAWMVGDTPDDQRAARAAGVVPLGFHPRTLRGPGGGEPFDLRAAGAARTLPRLSGLEELLP